MSKSEEILRLEGDLKEQPELKEKFAAEYRRIAEAGEAKCDGEAMMKAAASLGYNVTKEELERYTASIQELDAEEMDAAGGNALEDEYGHDNDCMAIWHCETILLHTETKEKYSNCFMDYHCHGHFYNRLSL